MPQLRVIRITEQQERAFGRIVQAEALNDLAAVFATELASASASYERAKEMLVETGENRHVALKLLGRKTALTDVVDLIERQRV